MEFNKPKQTVAEATRTTNYEGGEAFEPADPRLVLYKRTINQLLEGSFYETDDEQLAAVVRRFDATADEDTVVSHLDLEAVRHAPLYPFRYYQAYTALQMLTSRHQRSSGGWRRQSTSLSRRCLTDLETRSSRWTSRGRWTWRCLGTARSA